MLPSDVRTSSVQTLHIAFFYAWSDGKKPNQVHITEVEDFLGTSSVTFALSAMAIMKRLS